MIRLSRVYFWKNHLFYNRIHDNRGIVCPSEHTLSICHNNIPAQLMSSKDHMLKDNLLWESIVHRCEDVYINKPYSYILLWQDINFLFKTHAKEVQSESFCYHNRKNLLLSTYLHHNGKKKKRGWKGANSCTAFQPFSYIFAWLLTFFQRLTFFRISSSFAPREA